MTINTIKQVQRLLKAIGCSPGAIDGVWGAKSQTALDMAVSMHCASSFDKLVETTSLTVRPVDPNVPAWWAKIRHFSRSEMRCQCGGKYCNGYPAEMQEDVVRIADDAREHFGRPAYVVSGLRCREWNAHEGGVANSQHMYGEAIDLRIEGVDSETLRKFVAKQKNHRYSYCINGTNVHFDIPARPR